MSVSKFERLPREGGYTFVKAIEPRYSGFSFMLEPDEDVTEIYFKWLRPMQAA